ncbi:MAG: cysteine desulfurase [Lachnospiraceae bacterium]|nr:cysteine desulfurase [Lachnospiraceae bacterium]
MECYFDNSATTRVYPEVVTAMNDIMLMQYANPSSMHRKGMEAEMALRNARQTIAKTLKVDDRNILFTSGGTESDNMALIGCATAASRSGKHIITTRIEHPAILETCAYLKEQGYEITYLNVDKNGLIDLNELEDSIRSDTTVVSIMHTNNEIGAVEPVKEASKIIKKKNPGTLFHVDAVQGYGKFVINPKKEGIDLMSVSGHKIHGPKGIGFLYIANGVKINPIIHGGGQQKNLRSGTENVPGIVGLAKASQLIYERLESDRANMYAMKERLIKGLLEIEDIKINGLTGMDSAPHIVSASVGGVRSEVLLHALEDRDIYISAGSACASNKPAISETLKAIGVENRFLESTVRFSLCGDNSMDQIEYALEAIRGILPMLRRFTRH